MEMNEDRKKWNDRYASDEWFLGRNPSPYLVEQIEFIKRLVTGREALDIACGEGRNSLFLARHGFHVKGVDISDVGLAKARRRAADEGLTVSFDHVDLEQYEMVERYDLIINFNFLLRELVPRLVDALVPGGVLVFDTILDAPNLPGSHNKAFLLQPGELPELFRSYPGSIHAYREMAEGVSPTAKLIFRKE